MVGERGLDGVTGDSGSRREHGNEQRGIAAGAGQRAMGDRGRCGHPQRADGFDVGYGAGDRGAQDAVWAIVRGLPASTQDSGAATNPSTEPMGEAATQPVGETRLMVCQLTEGKWTKAERIPDGVSGDPGRMALTVVKGLPVLAWRTGDGRLCVSSLSAEGKWSGPVVAGVEAGWADFKLLTINDRAVLWVASAPPTSRPTNEITSSGTMIGGAGGVLIGDDFARRIDLGMPTRLPANIGPQTLVAAFGNLRWIAYAGDQQIEQDYSLDAFPQSFPTAKLSVVPSPKPPVISLTPWIGGDAVLILLAGLAAIRQRNLPTPEADRKWARGETAFGADGPAICGRAGGSGADPGGGGDFASGECGESAGEHRRQIDDRACATVAGDVCAAHAAGGADLRAEHWENDFRAARDGVGWESAEGLGDCAEEFAEGVRCDAGVAAADRFY